MAHTLLSSSRVVFESLFFWDGDSDRGLPRGEGGLLPAVKEPGCRAGQLDARRCDLRLESRGNSARPSSSTRRLQILVAEWRCFLQFLRSSSSQESITGL